MKKLFPLFMVLMLTAPHAAYAKKQQANISGAKTETRVSGANTPEDNKDGSVHASGATTSSTGKAAAAKNAGKTNSRHSPDGTQKLNDKHPAPEEVRKPYQPKQAAVEQPHSPKPPRTPVIPRGK